MLKWTNGMCDWRDGGVHVHMRVYVVGRPLTGEEESA